MPIFTPVVSPAVQAATQAISVANGVLPWLIMQYNRGYNVVWKNRSATPDAVIAAFGTQAAAIFADSAELAAFINGKQSGAVAGGYPPGWNVAFNKDGSAVATFTPPAAAATGAAAKSPRAAAV